MGAPSLAQAFTFQLSTCPPAAGPVLCPLHGSLAQWGRNSGLQGWDYGTGTVEAMEQELICCGFCQAGGGPGEGWEAGRAGLVLGPGP